MRTSNNGIALIKRHEGLRLKPYLCRAGKPTIGYGHTGDVTLQSPPITEHQAEAILAFDLERFEEGVSHATRAIKLTQGQFDALVSFSFNEGTQALVGSTLLKKLLAGDVDGAAAEFARWNKAHVNGVLQVLVELTNRRADERALFLGIA